MGVVSECCSCCKEVYYRYPHNNYYFPLLSVADPGVVRWVRTNYPQATLLVLALSLSLFLAALSLLIFFVHF